MSKFLGLLRAIILPLGWICALLALATPVWFLVAALGTKWGFFEIGFGLDWMTHTAGFKLLLACLVAGALAGLLMLVHRALGREAFGVVTSPLLALAVAAVGLGWTWHINEARAATPLLLDVSSDTQDPPYFTPAFVARRSVQDESLDYAAKDLAERQAAFYPDLRTAAVSRPPEEVFRLALDYAHEQHWRVGPASGSACATILSCGCAMTARAAAWSISARWPAGRCMIWVAMRAGCATSWRLSQPPAEADSRAGNV